jgi:hypothetical protein
MDLLVHADLLSDLDELGSLDANVFNVYKQIAALHPINECPWLPLHLRLWTGHAAGLAI